MMREPAFLKAIGFTREEWHGLDLQDRYGWRALSGFRLDMVPGKKVGPYVREFIFVFHPIDAPAAVDRMFRLGEIMYRIGRRK